MWPGTLLVADQTVAVRGMGRTVEEAQGHSEAVVDSDRLVGCSANSCPAFRTLPRSSRNMLVLVVRCPVAAVCSDVGLRSSASFWAQPQARSASLAGTLQCGGGIGPSRVLSPLLGDW